MTRRSTRLRDALKGIAITLLLVLCLGLPVAAFATSQVPSEDPYADAVSVTWDDGAYLVEVALQGGSGRASVATPATVSVKEGKAVATIVWSSPNYDYMVVAGTTYLPTNEEGNSSFEIPVLAFDEPFDVVADTTAMSQPHEIDYTLVFDSKSARAQQAQGTFDIKAVVFATVCVGALAGVFASHRAQRTLSES